MIVETIPEQIVRLRMKCFNQAQAPAGVKSLQQLRARGCGLLCSFGMNALLAQFVGSLCCPGPTAGLSAALGDSLLLRPQVFRLETGMDPSPALACAVLLTPALASAGRYVSRVSVLGAPCTVTFPRGGVLWGEPRCTRIAGPWP